MSIIKNLENNRILSISQVNSISKQGNGVVFHDGINGENHIFLTDKDVLSLSDEFKSLIDSNTHPGQTPILDSISNAGVFSVYGNSGDLVITDGVVGVFSKSLDLSEITDLSNELEDMSYLNSIVVSPPQAKVKKSKSFNM